MLKVQYDMSSDPSKANDSGYCGPGPYSFERWKINSRFSVMKLDYNGSTKPSTLLTQLPSQPTGDIPKSAASTHTGAHLGWVVIFIALSLGVSV